MIGLGPLALTLGVCLLALLLAGDLPADVAPLPFTVKLEAPLQELHPDWCWFHPRAAALPGVGRDGRPAVVLTLQKHLKVSDYYSGLYFMRSDDGGATWTAPALPPELDWRRDGAETIAVCDVTPGWHAPTGRLLAIGVKLRYSATGGQLLDQPRSHELAYAAYDPAAGRWTPWQELALPHTDDKFFLVAPGCVQWLVNSDATLLIPIYFKGPTGNDYSVTVLHCAYDGHTLTYLRHGDELALAGGRGLCEPSLVRYRGRYFLTIRNDACGYVTTSDDGLHWAPLKPWSFDDGAALGSYNTQTHWLAHSDGLFLAYTRRGANNDHIARHRAPLFLAQVDPERLCVMRATEQVLLPERGVMLGNFGANAVDERESWVTDAEYAFGPTPHPRGADGRVFLARVQWSQPNRLLQPTRIICLGDSITKGVRAGVQPEQTFAWLLERELQRRGHGVAVLNLGLGGERTDQALARLERDVLARRPALVTIMYGTNDSYVDIGATASRLTAAQYRGNLVDLIARLRGRDIQPVLMTEPRWGHAANGLNEDPNVRLAQYMAQCREVAQELRVPLVDHFANWRDHAAAGQDLGAWTTDQCHPNPAGHAVLAETMLPVIEGLLTD